MLNASVGELNFKNVVNKLGDVMYTFPFSLPPYYIAIIRCLGVLEGVAIQVRGGRALVPHWLELSLNMPEGRCWMGMAVVLSIPGTGMSRRKIRAVLPKRSAVRFWNRSNSHVAKTCV